MADEQVVKLFEGAEVSVEAEGLVVESFVMPRSAELIVAARGESSLFVVEGRERVARGAPSGAPGLQGLLASGKERGVIRYGTAMATVHVNPA